MPPSVSSDGYCLRSTSECSREVYSIKYVQVRIKILPQTSDCVAIFFPLCLAIWWYVSLSLALTMLLEEEVYCDVRYLNRVIYIFFSIYFKSLLFCSTAYRTDMLRLHFKWTARFSYTDRSFEQLSFSCNYPVTKMWRNRIFLQYVYTVFLCDAKVDFQCITCTILFFSWHDSFFSFSCIFAMKYDGQLVLPPHTPPHTVW